jgi:hypothetical protein
MSCASSSKKKSLLPTPNLPPLIYMNLDDPLEVIFQNLALESIAFAIV